ncbi:MAG: virulence RhuM family protein [Myxococcales bacterium]|nr:virulence RhuM family protein [Myxococcales bacterium]
MSRDKGGEMESGGGLGEVVVFPAEDGTAKVQVRLVEGMVWLPQRQIASLYDKDIRTISEHLANIYDEQELDPAATIRKFRIVQEERNRTGSRQVARVVEHYNLPAIIAVGYRVRSAQGTRFRQWATARLTEFAVKGFTLDDERLKNPSGAGGTDYFEELLARIRDIRSSEKVFYKKVLEIYATSVDYDPSAEASQRFFATVQNKLHYAVHGQTAAEVIAARADAEKPNMGLTSWTGARPRRTDALQSSYRL